MKLSDESLRTLLCEVESIINSRPIVKTSDDINDASALTPNHLLLLRECPQYAPGIFQESDLYRRRWRAVQHLANDFWRRWTRQYLPELQRRQKWLSKCRNVKVGDLVLIINENTPRGVWPIALVKETFSSDDDLIRSVKVKTASSEFVRPVNKLVLLEGSDYLHATFFFFVIFCYVVCYMRSIFSVVFCVCVCVIFFVCVMIALFVYC